MKTTSEFVTMLFSVEVSTHIAHLQTTSFAQHAALKEIYQAMPELRDSFCEAIQGQYGIIKGYKAVETNEGVDMVTYINKCCKEATEYRNTLTEGYLQQDVDDILQQFNSTLYKLKFLK